MKDKEEINAEIERMEEELGIPSHVDQPQGELKLGYWTALKWVMEDEQDKSVNIEFNES